MNKNPKGWILFLYWGIFMFASVANAQDAPSTPILLKDLLFDLEATYDIRFSYIDKDIDSIRISVPDGDLDLRQHLEFFERETSLQFEILNERYIAIVKLSQESKLCGRVRDLWSGEPIIGARVTGQSGEIGVTDEYGRFILISSGSEENFTIKYPGYRERILNTEAFRAPADCLDVFLEPAIEQLGEVMIIDYLTSGISKLQNGATQIDIDRFGTLPGSLEPDVLEAVSALPGVVSIDETISNINIRGGTSDQNLVLFDGVKMYLTGHFFGLISAFNPNLVQSATLIKNGTSAQYNEGVSGTLNISSKNELSGTFSAGAGLNLISADVFFQIPLSEKVELHLSGRNSLNGLLSTPTYDTYFSRSLQDSEISYTSGSASTRADFNFYDASLKVLYDVNPDQKLRFTALQVTNDLGYLKSSEADPVLTSRRSSLAQKNLAFGGTWTADWTESFSTETHSYLTRYQLDSENYDVESDQRLVQQNEVLENGLTIDASYSFHRGFEFKGGYHFSEVGVSNIEKVNQPFFSSTIKNVIRTHSMYSELVYSKRSTYLSAGLRLNYLGKLDTFLLQPRLSFHQDLTQEVGIKLQGEFKSQTTSQIIDLQEDFLGVESRRWILADNSTFPIIKSRHISAGLDYKENGWYVDLAAYVKEVSGISTSTQGFQNQYEFLRSSGSYTSRGLEFLANKDFGSFHTYLSYTFGLNDYSFDDLTPSEFPNNFDIRHTASLAGNYSFRNFRFSLGGQFHSGKPYTSPVEGEETMRNGSTWMVRYASPNSENLPPYYRVDFSSSYTFEFSDTGRIKLGVSLLNLLNRKNIINRYYMVDPQNQRQAIKIDNSSLGFTPNALIRVVF